MDKEWVVGIFGTLAAFLSFLGGGYQARRAGASSESVALIGDWSRFRDALMNRLELAEKRADDCSKLYQAMHDELHAAKIKYEPLVIENAQLRVRIDELEAAAVTRDQTIDDLKARLAAHEKRYLPRSRKPKP